MSTGEKREVQHAWQSGEYHVIVATIAFGMGIDKPDVRFVIHYSVPKTLEGYYQETGRAGRDGERSHCYMFYGGRDIIIHREMIKKGDGSDEQKQRQLTMLKSVVQFCLNKTDCRRLQVLRYFNETFDKSECRRSCDNCTSEVTFKTIDISNYAKLAVGLVSEAYKALGINPSNKATLGKYECGVTMRQLIQIFHGGRQGKPNKAARLNGWDRLPQYGAGANLGLEDTERLFSTLLAEEALREENKPNIRGFVNQYIMVSICDATLEFVYLVLISLVLKHISFRGRIPHDLKWMFWDRPSAKSLVVRSSPRER
jgi:bloom syndrome protein